MVSLKVRPPATDLRGDFEPGFSLELALKDPGSAQELAPTNTPMPLGALRKRNDRGDGPQLGRPRRFDLCDRAIRSL
jgi:hypothetical protein